jgi:hypothetical protein
VGDFAPHDMMRGNPEAPAGFFGLCAFQFGRRERQHLRQETDKGSRGAIFTMNKDGIGYFILRSFLGPSVDGDTPSGLFTIG